MPKVMDSSLFCFGISKLISNYTSVGFDSVWEFLITKTTKLYSPNEGSLAEVYQA